jgi:cation diffusion facilitator CzcD-associated flavoprotein CzcO
MAYRDTPFNDDIPLFPRAQHVEDYLRSYAREHGLLRYIRFETTVVRVYQVGGGGGGLSPPLWVVESHRKGEEQGEGVVTETYDFVSVTSGHYEKASVPEIEGLE